MYTLRKLEFLSAEDEYEERELELLSIVNESEEMNINFVIDEIAQKERKFESKNIDKILLDTWGCLVKINTKSNRNGREYFAKESLKPLTEAMQYVEHYKGSFRSAIEEAYHVMTRVNKNMKTMTSRQIYEESHNAFMCVIEARVLRGCGFANPIRPPTEKERQVAEKELERLKIY